jgi:hypothetical protein
MTEIENRKCLDLRGSLSWMRRRIRMKLLVHLGRRRVGMNKNGQEEAVMDTMSGWRAEQGQGDALRVR